MSEYLRPISEKTGEANCEMCGRHLPDVVPNPSTVWICGYCSIYGKQISLLDVNKFKPTKELLEKYGPNAGVAHR